ncbi:MAG: ABC transporter ATP-binding protein [Lachnospiraceae bacterium]|nr:ABC transporter ATP-binding protein [Lachnospiraceae bacterium]
MDIKDNIRNLSSTIKPYWGEMTLAIVSSLLKQGAIIGQTITTAYMVGLAMDYKLMPQLCDMLGLLVGFIVARALFLHLEMYFAHDVAFRTIRDFRLSIYKKLNDLAPAYTCRKQTGQIAQNFVGDVEILELFLAHTFSSFIVAFIVATVLFIVLLTISPVIAVVMMVYTILLGTVPYVMRQIAARQGDEVRANLAEHNSMLMEIVQGLREITMLNAIDDFRSRIHGRQVALYESQKEYGARKGSESMMNHILTGTFTVIVALVAAGLVMHGQLELELYPVAVMLSTVILNPAMEVASVAQEMGIVFSASNRIQNLFKEKPKVDCWGDRTLNSRELQIDFENVSFAYEDDNPVLEKVSFTVTPGERVAIVGASGVGKTTCANLLLRYYDCDEGAIKINGVDIRDLSHDYIRENISAVQQDTYLFHETVAENIALGMEDVSMDDIVEAAKISNAHEFILGLPAGYDTITGERGYRLSGGQRQRIAIARTILRDTPIVIFDEALSSLDTENETYIQHMLEENMSHKTVITIAHRISTIKSADKVVMLKAGQVCAMGSHEELLNTNSDYRELIMAQ